MTGYLQRIVAQTTKPQGNIHPVVHPLVGSLWSGAKHETTGEAFPEQTLFTSATQPEPVPTRIGPNSSSPARSEGSAETAHESAGRIERSSEYARFQPLLGNTDAEAPSIGVHFAPHDLQENPRRDHQVPKTSDTGHEIVFRDASAPRSETQLGPTPLRHQEVPGQAYAPHSAEARKRMPPVSRPVAGAPPHSPDEIQINIGRIEVTAIPQPTPRPAAPARKSINLDEYLKRRNGRNG